MRLAIIGLGQRIATVTANLLATSPGRFTVAGWSDPQAQPPGLAPLAAAADKHAVADKHGTAGGAGQGFTDHREMIATLRPDAILVGSPNHLHLEHVRDALATGCPVFCEKPAVISPEETWAMAALLREHPGKLVVGLVLRCAPLFRSALAAVQGGRLGRPVSLEANEILAPEHGAFIARDWRRFRRYSGSHLLEKCCHDLDLIQALLGSRVLRAASFGGRGIFTPGNRPEGDAVHARYRSWPSGWAGEAAEDPFTAVSDIVDHQVVAAEMENGARLTFHVNNHGAWGQRRWLLLGTRGTWESDLGSGRSRLQSAFGAAEEVAPPAVGGGHYGADEQMARDLAATWLDGVPFPVPTPAALSAGLAAMGIDLAQREGRVVDLGKWWKRLDDLLGEPAVAPVVPASQTAAGAAQ